MRKEGWPSSGEDAYAVLGVPADADADAIVAAYRALARRHHPDIAGDAQTARMSRINAAFSLLRDPRRRAGYDRDRGGTRGATTAAGDRRPRAMPGWRAENDGTGAAGPPPGRPSGSVLDFGRHIGWSIGEIARVDPGYLEWLEDHRAGRPFLDEIDETLVRIGFRAKPRRPQPERRTVGRRRLGWS